MSLAASDRRTMMMKMMINQQEQRARLAHCNWMFDCTGVETVKAVVKDNKPSSSRIDRSNRMEEERIPCSHVQEVEEEGLDCNNGSN